MQTNAKSRLPIETVMLMFILRVTIDHHLFDKILSCMQYATT